MKQALHLALAVGLLSGTATAEEYRGDVSAPGHSELQLDFASSHYNGQTWQRPGSNTNDDDSGSYYLSDAWIRYDSGSAERRLRIRTTGYTDAINTRLSREVATSTSRRSRRFLSLCSAASSRIQPGNHKSCAF